MNEPMVLVPREMARALLETMMREISEDCWCAGWFSGNEVAIWHLARKGGGDYGQGQVSQEQAGKLLILADALQEWVEWDHESGGTRSVPIAEWIAAITAGRDQPNP